MRHVPRASDDRAGRRPRGVPRPVGTDMGDEVREAFEEWRALEVLGGVGRVWKRPYDVPPALLVGSRSEIVEHVARRAQRDAPSVRAIVGEHGDGKTALAPRRARPPRRSGRVRGDRGAGACGRGVHRGAGNPGEGARRAMRGRDMIWVLPELQEALFAGQHTPQPARAARRAAAQHRVRRDHGRRRGHADRARAAADIAGRA